MAADSNLPNPLKVETILDKRILAIYVIACVAVAGSAWTAFGSDSVSGSTIASIVAVVIGLLVVSATALRSSRSTRSVAHVLYETEHQRQVIGPPSGAAGVTNSTDAS